MKFYIKTLGCKLNRYDSDQLADKLIQQGLSNSENARQVDLLIVNSCTVTNSADHKSRQAITNLKKQAPNAKVIVTGCGTKSDTKQFEEKKEVNFVSREEKEILEYVKNTIIPLNRKKTKDSEFKNKQTNNDNQDTNSLHPPQKKLNTHTRANIKIQNGCDNYCSYCIIAFVRGDSYSLSAEKIIQEITQKEKQGFQEIVLTGINIGAYGASVTTKPQENTLEELLEKILTKTQIPRIRLSSIGPQYFSNKLIQVLKNPRICRHLHLSIQSGSNSILKRMNRPYTIEFVIKLSEKLRNEIPDIALTSDIITGFPEETDKEHQETLMNLEKIKLMKTHIFPYSIRNGTVAAKMKQIPHQIKIKRKKELAELAKKMREDFLNKQIGKTKKVLFELKNKQRFWEGYTENYIRVQIESTENSENQIREIVLTKKNVLY